MPLALPRQLQRFYILQLHNGDNEDARTTRRNLRTARKRAGRTRAWPASSHQLRTLSTPQQHIRYQHMS